ncbi:hypothetical protein [Candidatus Soleaferrea massiliensis]|uniref:hypothetical protein n=1 Tax=Candidatus Soleaferrea massiliensis TaxID=1470354 RepID=UPI0006950869|nr:hypothetical protein [Candidatus Soleaferrea massiliensis]
MDKASRYFEQAVQNLGESVRRYLAGLPDPIKRDAQEVRLRTGEPLQLGMGDRLYFIDKQGAAQTSANADSVTCTKETLQESFRALCQYSVHSHIEEIRNGFISVKGGHRAGICGTAVMESGVLTGVRDVSSINLRIAKQIPGAGSEVMKIFADDPHTGLLIIGAPSSGKTTILRDLTRQLSNGGLGRYLKIAVADERSEIAGVSAGQPQNDLGPCCDVLDGYQKADAIMIAVRCLSPDIIICDELGTTREAEAVEMGLNSGVTVIASAHASNPSEIQNKPQIRRLLGTGAFSRIVLLDNRERVGRIRQVIPVDMDGTTASLKTGCLS